MTDDNDFLDIAEAARFLKVSVTSLRRWTNSGVLPVLRVGRRRERRFRREDLLAFMEQPEARRMTGDAESQRSIRDSTEEPGTGFHGKHLCGIYGSDAGRVSLCVPFLLDGLREGSVCFLIGPAASREKVLKNLKDLRPSLSSDIKEGRLISAKYGNACRTQWKSLETHLVGAEKAGGTSFRMVGDIVGMRSRCSPAELVAYEAGIDNRIIARHPVTILCLYDARKFEGIELLNALKTHRETFRYPVGRLLA